MRSLTLILLPLLLAATSCVHSLYGAFTPETAVTDPAIEGKWSSKDANDLWEFADGIDGVYTMTVTDTDGLTGMFTASMFEVGGFRFLDVFPMTEEFYHGQQNPYYLYHFLPMHTFIRVDQIDPELVLSLMDPEWVGDYLLDHPDSVPHENADYLLLTGQADELQHFLVEVAPLDGSFQRGDPMQRVKEPAATQ